MPKRFVATEIWEEDWFLDMPNEYKLFWFYMLSACDHAGIFKVNLRSFSSLLEVKVSSTDALEYFNKGKDRIRVLSESVWYIEDFFVFQYGHVFNGNNRLHASIENIYNRHKIKKEKIRGLIDLKEGVKDKDKDKDKDSYYSRVKKIDKNIVGEKFTKDNLYVVLSNGEKQALGKNQKLRLSHNDIKPSEIFKNYIT